MKGNREKVLFYLGKVLCGGHPHTHIGIDYLGNGKYEIDTGLNKLDMQYNFKHCCNEISKNEVDEILTSAEENKELHND